MCSVCSGRVVWGGVGVWCVRVGKSVVRVCACGNGVRGSVQRCGSKVVVVVCTVRGGKRAWCCKQATGTTEPVW